MNLHTLLSEHPQVSITVSGKDLAEFARTVADEAAEAVLQRQDEKLYTRQEVIELLGVSSATLWRWDRTGILKAKRIGNKVFYTANDLKEITKEGAAK